MACAQTTPDAFDMKNCKITVVDTLDAGTIQRRFYNVKDTAWRAVELTADGSLSREFWFEGKREGPEYVLSAAGDTLLIANYHAGRKHGRYAFFEAGGRVREEGKYVEGKREGLWQQFDENGKFQQHEWWRNGIKVSKE